MGFGDVQLGFKEEWVVRMYAARVYTVIKIKLINKLNQ